MKIVIIGTGYVGLVSGVCLADTGHEVICVDVNKSRVVGVNKGRSPIYEDGLSEVLGRNVCAGRLHATTDLNAAIVGADVTMIAVGTPFDGNVIDLKYVRQAAKDVAYALQWAPEYHVVCLKSTIVPGTTETIVGPLLEKHSNRKIGVDLGLIMNPEFLAEGTAVKDFMFPDRIVIGASDPKAADTMAELYKPFLGADVIFSTLATAEMIKYTANSFLATVISFSNEMANLCSTLHGVDVVDVMKGVHADRRLSPLLSDGRITPGLMSFLYPGTGFGGSCFPKDVNALISFANSQGQHLPILTSVMGTNINQPAVTVDLLKKALGDSLGGSRIAILGLAFKPGTDDVRESPAIAIIESLLDEEVMITAHDPVAINNMQKILTNERIQYFETLEAAIDQIDAVILVTSWPEYKNLHEIIDSKQTPVIDGRRFLDKNNFRYYFGIGLNNN